MAADGTIVHPYAFTNFAADFGDTYTTDNRIPWVAANALEEFFETGLVNQTSLSIANRLSEGTSVNFNYGYLNDEGFIPNNNLARHNFGLGLNTKLSNGLQIGATFNYTDSKRNSPPACLLYTSPSPRDRQKSRMPSSA